MPRRNPPHIPRDTSPDVWHRQMDSIRAMSIADRMEVWDAHNRAVGQMEADWIRRRHPNYSDRQVFLAIVRRRYGDDLVSKAWPHEVLVEV